MRVYEEVWVCPVIAEDLSLTPFHTKSAVEALDVFHKNIQFIDELRSTKPSIAMQLDYELWNLFPEKKRMEAIS